MRAREILFALAAGTGALLVLHLAPGSGRSTPMPPAPGVATATERSSDPVAVHPAGRRDVAPAAEASSAGKVPGAATAAMRRAPRGDAGSGEDAGESDAGGGSSLAGLRARLGRPTREMVWLGEFHRYLGGPAPGPRSEGEPPANGERGASHLAAALDAAREAAADPVARQRLIFHQAIALPVEVARARLRPLRDGADPDDAEDALAALAFRGDPESMAAFRALAARPAPEWEPRLDPPEPGEPGARDALRAWRCIEALTGEAYFHVDSLGHGWSPGEPRVFPWAVPSTAERDALVRDLLPAWLARYPGHPGSDDAAWRLANAMLRAGDAPAAVRWASRGAAMPDGDMARPCVELVVAVAELLPRDVVAPALDPDPEAPLVQRGLLAYLRVRRDAADLGFATALAEVERLAEREPGLALAAAFRARRAEPPPRGLDDGVVPLPADDPLRVVEGQRLPETDAPADGTGDGHAGARDGRDAEAVHLPARRLAFQLRCWEAMAELDRRAAATTDPDARADLLHKAASVLRREADSLWPLYAQDSTHGACRPEPGRLEGWPGPAEDGESWFSRNLPLLRAATAFAGIRDGFPETSVADRAAFAAGVARIRASEKRPLPHSLRWGWPYSAAYAAGVRLAGVEDLERCARGWPASPLADDAAAAASYWRRREAAELGKE
jgi:hypothetical protein